MLFLGFGLAQAQTWSTEATGVLAAAAGLTANGVGSPTVVWDEDIDRYVMFFETRTGSATATCTGGTWSIGAAVSDDGLAWEVWPDPVISPTAGTPWACVAAHPSAVWDNGTYHLFFKAEQGLNACATQTQAWGCNNYSGVAHAIVDVELDDKTDEIAAVQAQIDAIEADLDAAMDAFAASLDAYDALLDAQQDEFACDDTARLCAPCAQATIVATKSTGAETEDFCQEFQFAIPNQVTVIDNGIGSHTVTMTVVPTTGPSFFCRYRSRGGSYQLDFNPDQAIQSVCSNGATVGTVVTVGDVTLAVTQSTSQNEVQATLILDATNYASQTYSGALLDEIDALRPLLAAYDYDGTESALPGFIAELDTLLAWLAGFSGDADKDLLETDGQALRDEAAALLDDLTTWEDDLAALEAELAELQSYTQSVVATLTSGVVLQINKVFGYPAAMKKGSTWVLMTQDYPNIRRATGTSATGPFVADLNPVISKGTVSWAQTEVFDPNLMCSGDPMFPYQVYFGGRTFSSGAFVSGGISDGISQDTASWLLNTATQLFGWSSVNEYRHFDVVRSSDGQYRMWYTERVGGLVQISLASTTASFQDDLATQRVCP